MKYISITKAAKELNLSPRTIIKNYKNGNLRGMRLHGRIYIDLESLEELKGGKI